MTDLSQVEVPCLDYPADDDERGVEDVDNPCERLTHQMRRPRQQLDTERVTLSAQTDVSRSDLALEAGVEMKVVSERLGHSQISITADLYTHVNRGLG